MPDDLHMNDLWEYETVCSSCNGSVLAAPLSECLVRTGFGVNTKWVKGCDEPKEVDPYSMTYSIEQVGQPSRRDILLAVNSEPVDLNKVNRWLRCSMNFNEFFRYMPLRDQAAVIGRRNPFSEEDEDKVALIHKKLQMEDTKEFTVEY
jgi:hypothetical protein